MYINGEVNETAAVGIAIEIEQATSPPRPRRCRRRRRRRHRRDRTNLVGHRRNHWLKAAGNFEGLIIAVSAVVSFEFVLKDAAATNIILAGAAATMAAACAKWIKKLISAYNENELTMGSTRVDDDDDQQRPIRRIHAATTYVIMFVASAAVPLVLAAFVREKYRLGVVVAVGGVMLVGFGVLGGLMQQGRRIVRIIYHTLTLLIGALVIVGFTMGITYLFATLAGHFPN